MAGETATPNIGLQVAGFNQPNWQVPTDYNWNLLDEIFGGEVQVPALSVVNLTAVNFTLPSVIATIASSFVVAVPSGSLPGTVFTFSSIPAVLFGIYVNGLWQRPTVDYTIAGNQITFAYTLGSTDNLYAVYLRS
jgi:hypothetical protein